jgi:hypothetical protein
MYLRPLIRGLATYVPGARKVFARGTGGTNAPRYCYSVWLRHLVMARRSGLPADPEVIAELGPGDSLGIGLCAVLTGARRYLAFDVVRYADTERNLRVFDELVELLRSRAPIPDEDEYARVDPRLDSYDFPGDILTDDRLTRALAPDRVAAARAALVRGEEGAPGDIEISYAAPWHDPEVVRAGSVDMIVSQAVLEHVTDLPLTYRAMYEWVKPGGVVAHSIDFRSHTYAREWNGHWAYSDRLWRLTVGNRPFLLNREPVSTHLALMAETGFEIVHSQVRQSSNGIVRERLAPRFRGMSDQDLTTQAAFVQARKPEAAGTEPR